VVILGLVVLQVHLLQLVVEYILVITMQLDLVLVVVADLISK